MFLAEGGGVDRSRDKEYKDIPLLVLPSGCHGITVAEADISTLHFEGIAADDDNYPDPDNVIQSDDILSTPLSLTFGFHVVNPWRQSRNLPVGRAKLKMTPILRIQHM